MPRPSEPDPRLPRLAESPGFIDYMGTGWATPDRTPATVPGVAAAAAAHRRRLSAVSAGRTIVVLAGRAPVRANDTYYGFRPDSDFFWLTGCDAEDAVVVMHPVAGGHDATLYIPAPAYPGEAGFFADPAHGELWVGSAPGMPEWSAALQIETKPLGQLAAALRGAADILLAGNTVAAPRELAEVPASTELRRTLAELRMIKDAWEIAELRRAVDDSVDGFAAVAREIPNAIQFGGERWLQGTFDRHARTVGNGPGYSTIVGSGAHAPILHWVRCDGPVLPDAALLLDMGVEGRSFYTADVTRTLPASGTFSTAQRAVHDLVEASHRAGLAAVGPGRQFSDFHTASLEVIARGLHDWGLLPVSVDEALSAEGQHHRRYIVCGIGHHLGLDVHDCAQSSYEAYQGAPMAPGMVLTVEPGLYFHAWDETVPPELRGIGVRIEDDILVTDSGSDVLSDALPIDAAGLEQWMRALV
ncbi:aminopeptidase P family protein [Microterricola viridarii]|uniref:Xaa-Pro aminopeptidase n=1 Tax=Microterricola viridarii TaxID=412690 RepID=A0A109QXP0_9MICO|nr:aminopeptidase P family protein [Microterricola viridarii]AMB60255.1 Xaa-Pro aminopeptidase [Microterricola viridarii]